MDDLQVGGISSKKHHCFDTDVHYMKFINKGFSTAQEPLAVGDQKVPKTSMKIHRVYMLEEET